MNAFDPEAYAGALEAQWEPQTRVKASDKSVGPLAYYPCPDKRTEYRSNSR